MIDNLSIAVHSFASRILTSLLGDEIILHTVQSIDLQIKPTLVQPHRARIILRSIVARGTLTVFRAPENDPHHWVAIYCHTQNSHLFLEGRYSPFSVNTISIF